MAQMNAFKITIIVFWGSLLGFIAWMALQADQMGGEPHKVVVLNKSQPAVDLLEKVDESKPIPDTLGDKDSKQDSRFSALPRPNSINIESSNSQNEKTFSQEMVPVPVKALVENSRYGPLPKISDDGRKASEIYARPFNLSAKVTKGQPKRIAIVITGLGLSALTTHGAIHRLPGPITLAFGPYGNNLQGWIRKARQLGHEVMLEVPLEPFDYPDNDPGPHTLLTSIAKEENLNRLQWVMGRFSGYIGITNAMGEKFLASGESTLPIFQELHRRGLAYLEGVEDGTQSKSKKLAQSVGMKYGAAHVKIDSELTIQDIEAKLTELEKIAEKNGFSIGIGSSLPLTIDLVAGWSKTLKKKNIILVPVSAAIRSYQPS